MPWKWIINAAAIFRSIFESAEFQKPWEQEKKEPSGWLLLFLGELLSTSFPIKGINWCLMFGSDRDSLYRLFVGREIDGAAHEDVGRSKVGGKGANVSAFAERWSKGSERAR